MATLYIIDAFAQFFRAYHAIRTPMTSPVTKEPTNMTFGFVGMLLKLLRGEGNLGGPPDYLIVATDASGDRGTFRSQLYQDYKAHRPEPPEDLGPQVERCFGILRELGVPIVGSEGYEADDVIATLVCALRRTHPDLKIRIISKDKDLKQLLETGPCGPAVELYDVHTDRAIDEQTLLEETGLRPDQVIDMLSLMGDTVDNVPGVEGVGEKTAAQLLREYGTLDNLLAHAVEIKGKRGEKLREAAALLPLSRKLVTLVKETPLPEGAIDMEAAGAGRIPIDRLIPILRELGFNRYQDEVRQLLERRAGGATAAGDSGASGPVPGRATDAGPGVFSESLFGEPAGPGGAPTGPPRKIVQGEYACVVTREQLAALVEDLRAAPVVAVDTETTGLSAVSSELCGISVSTAPGTGAYVPVRGPGEHLDERTVVEAMRAVLQDECKPKILHHAKFDILALRKAGLTLRGLTAEGACDPMIAAFLVDSSRSSYGLESLSLALLGHGKQPISELIGSGRVQRSFDSVPLAAAATYAAGDADLTFQLAEKLMPQVRALGLADLLGKLELPLSEALAEMEWNGILVDPEELDRQRAGLESQISDLRSRIDDAAMATIGRTFDPDSPRQLSAALFNKAVDHPPGLGIRPLRKTKTGHSTDADVLERIAADPATPTAIPNLILEYRQLTKLVNTYLVALREAINPVTKRIHASFHQTAAATGRLASSDPNLQNVPIRTEIGREIRKAFVAPPGQVLITADYSQIELRLLAHLSRDPALTEAFHKGADIHTEVAAQIHGVSPEKVTREQRSGAKMVNFGIVYGITAFGLARRLGIPEKAAAEIITGYKRRFAGISTFLEECIAQARRYGYVETMLKRRRPITEIDARDPSRRALAERVAINSVVQGSAADLIKLAMVEIHREIMGAREGTMAPGALVSLRMLLQIHDELVFESPEEHAEEAMRFVVGKMEGAMTLSVPLRVDAHAGRNWYEGK